jgi:hypothetical protein
VAKALKTLSDQNAWPVTMSHSEPVYDNRLVSQGSMHPRVNLKIDCLKWPKSPSWESSPLGHVMSCEGDVGVGKLSYLSLTWQRNSRGRGPLP